MGYFSGIPIKWLDMDCKKPANPGTYYHLEYGGSEDIDCYIACFCGDSDILSQWRDYCRDDGISIGSAFDETRPCYYFKDAADDEQEPRRSGFIRFGM